MEKLPPIEKIPEAWSAIADERVVFEADNTASVDSSDRTKRYSVHWEENVYAADDSATVWAGYPGYPVLAVLMKQGILPLDMEIAEMFQNVNWKELNTRFRRKYDEALAFVIQERGLDAKRVHAAMEAVYAALETMDLEIRRYRKGKKKTT